MSDMDHIFKIKVLNWSKVNKGRGDVKFGTWFKFKQDFFDDEKMFDLSHEEKLFWVYILCECGKQINASNRSGWVTLNIKKIHRVYGFSEKTIYRTIGKFQQLQILETRTLRGRYVDVTPDRDRERERELHMSKTSFDSCDEIVIPEETTHLSENLKADSHWLQVLWNENCGKLSKVIKLTGRRRKLISSRIKDEPDPEKWKEAIRKIAASKFCCGEVETKNTIRAWQANFDWLLKPDTLIKVLEGQYDNKSVSKKIEFGPRKEWDMTYE